MTAKAAKTRSILALALLAPVLVVGLFAWLSRAGRTGSGEPVSTPVQSGQPGDSANGQSQLSEQSALAGPTDAAQTADSARSDARASGAPATPRDPAAEPDWSALAKTRLSGKGGPLDESQRWFERYVLLGLERQRFRADARGANAASLIGLVVKTSLDAKGRFNEVKPGGSSASGEILLHDARRSYAFQRGEFPDFDAVNDFWRSHAGSAAQIDPALRARIEAQVEESMAFARRRFPDTLLQ